MIDTNNIYARLLKMVQLCTYYPRLFLDKIIFVFIHNDYSILEQFHNQDCLIVGNGPSLNKTELERINMPSLGMNKINLLFDKTDWRPDAVVCVNGLVIRQNSEFFNSTNIPLILPVKALYLGIKKRPNIIFVKFSKYDIFKSDISKTIGEGSTVTYTCMQIAAFSNVKSINIVGVDHTFNNNKSSRNRANEIEILEGDDQNHFDPNYFKNMSWGIPDLDSSEIQYAQALKYFTKKNIPVTDYTIEGKCNVFKKRPIEEIYN